MSNDMSCDPTFEICSPLMLAMSFDARYGCNHGIDGYGARLVSRLCAAGGGAGDGPAGGKDDDIWLLLCERVVPARESKNQERIECEFGVGGLIVNLQSICFQPRGPKLLANALDQSRRRRFCIVEGVIDTELLPFVTTHLMKRQHIHAFDISQARRKRSEVIDVAFVVRQIPALKRNATTSDGGVARAGARSRVLDQHLSRPGVYDAPGPRL